MNRRLMLNLTEDDMKPLFLARTSTNADLSNYDGVNPGDEKAFLSKYIIYTYSMHAYSGAGPCYQIAPSYDRAGQTNYVDKFYFVNETFTIPTSAYLDGVQQTKSKSFNYYAMFYGMVDNSYTSVYFLNDGKVITDCGYSQYYTIYTP